MRESLGAREKWHEEAQEGEGGRPGHMRQLNEGAGKKCWSSSAPRTRIRRVELVETEAKRLDKARSLSLDTLSLQCELPFDRLRTALDRRSQVLS